MPNKAMAKDQVTPTDVCPAKKGKRATRRAFLGQIGGSAAVVAGVAIAEPMRILAAGAKQDAFATGDQFANTSENNGRTRAVNCFDIRVAAAQAELNVRLPKQVTNGDEQRFPNHIGNYSKGLAHNNIGEVLPSSYASLLHALNSGRSGLFDQIQMGGRTPLIDPQCGLAFDLEGADSHCLAIGTPPSVSSQEIADTAIENYWMALCRDINFTQYGQEPLTRAAIAELNSLPAFNGPKPVTPQTLFRGFTAGDVIGPYVSQFLLTPFNYGAVPVTQLLTTYAPGVDYMTDQASWLAVQNGQGPFAKSQADPNPQHMRNGRGLGAYVHVDVLFEAYFNACLVLVDQGASLDPNNPYASSSNQTGFGTFGAPHLKTLVAEVSQRALKAVWYQKWFVHRHLRPEAFGGLVHIAKTKQASYPLHSDVLNSEAVARVFAKYNSYFLPHAFPEGCPQHPSYGQGHSTVAGACATIVKAWFDDQTQLTSIPGITISQASEDGFSLVPYTGSDGDKLTIGGEMNKLAANIGVGRNHAGVHWRHDYVDSLPLGEAVAISMLRDMGNCWNQPFEGFSFTKFDGTRISGVGKNT